MSSVLGRCFRQVICSGKTNFPGWKGTCGSYVRPSNAAIISAPQRFLLSYGQPTIESHSEFFSSPLEVMPGIYREELKSRRSSLCSMAVELTMRTKQHSKDLSHLIFIPSSRKKLMTENIPYPFRQNSNFLYLSGSFDMEAFILLCVTPREEFHLYFIADPDPTSELWDGPRTSVKAAVEHFGFDKAFLMSEFDGFIREFVRVTNNRVKVWCEDRSVAEKLFHPSYGFDMDMLESPRPLLDVMRVVKSPGEVSLMRQSCKLASEAFQESIKFCANTLAQGKSLTEHQIYAKIDYECRMKGADRLSYPPVIASGPRANVIHYVFNSNKCFPDSLILVDAGCEFFGYCSDITRTWPISGKFSNEKHRCIYEMVLQVQTELIKAVAPGVSLDQLFKLMSALIVKGLEELGIVRKGLSGSTGADLALRFCPHHVGHYLGLDVHDVSTFSRAEPLQEGMVVTVEPGVYIRNTPSQKDVLTKAGKEFIGIACRIEDDVLVTPEGHNVLSSSCPKSIEDIERWGKVDLAKS